MIQEIISQLPNKIRIDTKRPPKYDKENSVHESEHNIDVDLKDYSVNFYCEIREFISGYIPSTGPEVAPEYPEVESCDIIIHGVYILDSEGEEYPMEDFWPQEITDLMKELKDRIVLD